MRYVCMCVCRYYCGFWQNGSYLYGLWFYHGDQNGSYVYGLWFCHGDQRLWQLTLVLCVKCMSESILFLSNRETMRLELGKFASLSREDDPNLFPEMPCWRLLKTNYCFFFLALQTLVASGINFLLQLWCVEKGGPFIVSLYVPIQMIVVAMLSILTLGDPLYMGMYVLSLFSLQCK